ncbi:MAG: VWA domain-containing protein, partial [Kiritimatiellia bacterium]
SEEQQQWIIDELNDMGSNERLIDFVNREREKDLERDGLTWQDVGGEEAAPENYPEDVFRDYLEQYLDLSATGEEVYKQISDVLGSPKAASEFLARAGIDGVKYPVDSYGGKSVKDGDVYGWNYVSFRDDNIRVDHKWVDGEKKYSVSTRVYNPDAQVQVVDGRNEPAFLNLTTSEIRKYLRDKYMGREVVIDSDGTPVLFTGKGLNSALKKRDKHKRVLHALDGLVKKSHYTRFEKNDGQEKHKNLIGQLVYTAAIRLADGVYGVELKLDVPKSDPDGTHFKGQTVKTKIADAVLSVRRANGVERTSTDEASAEETVRLGEIVSTPRIMPQGGADAQGRFSVSAQVDGNLSGVDPYERMSVSSKIEGMVDEVDKGLRYCITAERKLPFSSDAYILGAIAHDMLNALETDDVDEQIGKYVRLIKALLGFKSDDAAYPEFSGIRVDGFGRMREEAKICYHFAMNFAYPVYLFVLWLLPVIGIVLWWKRHRHLSAARLFRGGTAPIRPEGRFVAQSLLCLTGVGFLVVAAARPQWGTQQVAITETTRNLLVLLDVSRSMLSEDNHPNRLGRACADLLDLVDSLEGDRCGIMVFRKSAVMVCPFTTDLAFLRTTLENVSIDSAPRGETDVGRALETALDSFRNKQANHNAILLVSDGEDLSGKGLVAARKCAEQKIPVFCIGVGSEQGATIPNQSSVLTYKGEKVISKMNPASLIEIANLSGGVYLPIESTSADGNSLGTIYRDHVRKIVRYEQSQEEREKRIERYAWFLIPGLLCLFAAAWLSKGRPKISSLKRGNGVAAGLVVFLFLAPAFIHAEEPEAVTNHSAIVSAPVEIDMGENAPEKEAQTRRALARMAQLAPAKQAMQLYRKALQAPDDGNEALAERIRLNAGLAALAANDPMQAIDFFREATPHPNASEGLGLAYFAIGKDDASLVAATNHAMRASAFAEKEKAFQNAALHFRDALQRESRNAEAAARLETNLVSAASLACQYRESARQEQLNARVENKSSDEILSMIRDDAAKAYALAVPAFTNAAPAQIEALEAASARQKGASELWPVFTQMVMEQLRQSETNLTVLAEVENLLKEASDASSDASIALEDLIPESLEAMKKADRTAFGVQVQLTDPVQLLNLAIPLQSNALAHTVAPEQFNTPTQSQLDGINVYDLFLRKRNSIPIQVVEQKPEQETPVQGKPQAILLTEAEKNEYETLCAETGETYRELRKDLLPRATLLSAEQRLSAEKALANLIRIRDLLLPPQQQKQPDQQSQSQNREQEKQPQKKTDSDQQQKKDSPQQNQDDGQNDQNQPSGETADSPNQTEEQTEEKPVSAEA